MQRVLSHQDDTALLKAYIAEWRKFFTQCDILPKPFCQLEITLMGKQGSNKKSNVEDSIVRKVGGWGFNVLNMFFPKGHKFKNQTASMEHSSAIVAEKCSIVG